MSVCECPVSVSVCVLGGVYVGLCEYLVDCV